MSSEKELRKAADAVRLIASRVPLAESAELVNAAERIEAVADIAFGEPRPLVRTQDEWVEALLYQASAELRVARAAAIGRPGETPEEGRARIAVMAMLLQMVFEKITKAAIARSDFAAFHNVRMSHATASRMVATIRQRIRFRNDAFRRFNADAWKVALGVIVELELAHPALARSGPHLEYPWETADKVAVPGRDLAVVARLADPKQRIGPDLLGLADHLLAEFPALFG